MKKENEGKKKPGVGKDEKVEWGKKKVIGGRDLNKVI